MDSAQNKSQQTSNLLNREELRYQRKGYGLFFAIVFTVLGFYVYPFYVQIPILTYLQNFSIKQIQMIMLIGTHIIGFSVGNFGMYLIYSLKIPFFEKYRTRSNPWPWDENLEQWKIKKQELLKSVMINMCIGIGMCIFDALIDGSLRTDIESFPTQTEIIWQIIFSMFLEDTCFYWSHRTLHQPYFYGKIHKKHHEYYTTVSYAAIYAHPIEYIFGNVVPVFVGSKLLGSKMHIATLQLWLMLRIGETIDGHSGYEFSWSPFRLLPFSNSAESHNYHHSHNIGNYGSFFQYWDYIMGSDIQYQQFLVEKYNKQKMK